MRTEFSDNQAKYKRGGVHRRLRESNSLSNLSADPIRIGVNSNRIGRYVDATLEEYTPHPEGWNTFGFHADLNPVLEL